MSSKPTKSILAKINRELGKLVTPGNLFSGVRVEDSLYADNIIIFKRTSAEEMRPLEVSHNYHHRFVLVTPIERNGHVHVDGVSYPLEPGLAHVIFPHQFHHFLNTEKGRQKWLFITFDCKNEEFITPLRNSTRILNSEGMKLIEEILRKYASAGTRGLHGLELVYQVSCLLGNLLESREILGGDAAPDKEDSKGDILQRINQYVRENLDKQLTIADVATHTGYSISYLRAVFRKELGVSLGAYMRDSRLSVAAAMLSSPDRPSIEEIAKSCGFISIFAFSRAFKKAMGVSPSAYGKMRMGEDLA